MLSRAIPIHYITLVVFHTLVGYMCSIIDQSHFSSFCRLSLCISFKHAAPKHLSLPRRLLRLLHRLHSFLLPQKLYNLLSCLQSPFSLLHRSKLQKNASRTSCNLSFKTQNYQDRGQHISRCATTLVYVRLFQIVYLSNPSWQTSRLNFAAGTSDIRVRLQSLMFFLAVVYEIVGNVFFFQKTDLFTSSRLVL